MEISDCSRGICWYSTRQNRENPVLSEGERVLCTGGQISLIISVLTPVRQMLLKIPVEVRIVEQISDIRRISCATAVEQLLHKLGKGDAVGIAAPNIVGCCIEAVSNDF